MKTVGQKIKEMREDRDMTQEDLAKKIRRNVRSIQYYERDEQITLDILKDIANALDVNTLNLLTTTDDLFKLFLINYNFKHLSSDEYKILKSKFSALLDSLANEYKS